MQGAVDGFERHIAWDTDADVRGVVPELLFRIEGPVVVLDLMPALFPGGCHAEVIGEMQGSENSAE